ncbi:MAG: hypothetical protein HY301_15130 [Verrucomicrobia bacterium]|nr:hypothetical protein [Verrucomicrobiota bacterium]
MILRRKLFLQEYIGLANRLESLTLAFAIRCAHGHQVFLDWPELDALVIEGVPTRAPGPLGRLGALRLRECPPEVFARLGEHRKILLRTYLGPDDLLNPLYLPTLERIRIRPHIAEEIRGVFAPVANRPVVGVHIRRGDYPLGDPDEYDTNSTKHPAVPLWWYEQAMAALVKRHGDAVFYLSFSGQGAEFESLRKNFDLIQARTRSPYGRVGTGHHAELHPVVDLFALACCPVVLGTPLSSFSHYAAHLLGPASACLLPPVQVKRNAWAASRLDLRGQRLPVWSAACRSGKLHELLSADLREVPAAPARTSWLPVAG